MDDVTCAERSEAYVTVVHPENSVAEDHSYEMDVVVVRADGD